MNKMDRLCGILALLSGLRTTIAQGYPPPPSLPETNFLDHNAPIAAYQGKTFLKQNIPYIDIPDSNIQNVYYFRWYALSPHLVYAAPGTGYVITEFALPVSYAGPFGTIDAAAGHQIEEARWLRSSWFSQDDVQIYTRGTANTMQYTHWIHHSAEATANTTGDQSFLRSQLDGMVRIYRLWSTVFNANPGLYYYEPDFDAQEYSLPGYVSNAAVGGANGSDLQYYGPNTYRPSHNSYMFANAQVIANIARAVGNTTYATQYQTIANNLEQAIYNSLWNTTQQFFVDNIISSEPAPGQVSGREEVGFFPFRFGLGLTSKYANPTVAALMDKNSFFTPYGPPTLEVNNTYFTPTKPTSYCCYWQGQSWPYSTAHVLKSAAQLYRSGFMTNDQYYTWLSIYASTQYRNGTPWVAESHYPYLNSWSEDEPNRSEYYAHSTYNDLVITGLLGVIPRSDNIFQINPIVPSNWTYFALENLPYHGNLITVLYDKNNVKYKQGAGLTIICNNKTIYNGAGLNAQVALPATPTSTVATASPVNIAVNPYVTNNYANSYPKITGTYTWVLDSFANAIDGYILYEETPANRWTNYDSSGTQHASDSLNLTLARPRNLTGIALAIFQDKGLIPKGLVACPQSILVTDNKGNTLASIPDFLSICSPGDLNIVNFSKTFETQYVNVKFFGQAGYAVGVTEMQLWVPGNPGPLYLAADAITPGGVAGVVFDATSTATSNGAVVSMPSSGANLQFSGVLSPSGGAARVQLRYRNTGSASVTVQLRINQEGAGSFSLQPAAGYTTVTLGSFGLPRGTSFVNVLGGARGLTVESITVG